MADDDEPQIFRDLRRVDPRNAVSDAEGGNAAARRMWNGPEPETCHMLGCTAPATTVGRMHWCGVEHSVPICAAHGEGLWRSTWGNSLLG